MRLSRLGWPNPERLVPGLSRTLGGKVFRAEREGVADGTEPIARVRSSPSFDCSIWSPKKCKAQAIKRAY
jgi:hypothetical protein